MQTATLMETTANGLHVRIRTGLMMVSVIYQLLFLSKYLFQCDSTNVLYLTHFNVIVADVILMVTIV